MEEVLRIPAVVWVRGPGGQDVRVEIPDILDELFLDETIAVAAGFAVTDSGTDAIFRDPVSGKERVKDDQYIY